MFEALGGVVSGPYTSEALCDASCSGSGSGGDCAAGVLINDHGSDVSVGSVTEFNFAGVNCAEGLLLVSVATFGGDFDEDLSMTWDGGPILTTIAAYSQPEGKPSKIWQAYIPIEAADAGTGTLHIYFNPASTYATQMSVSWISLKCIEAVYESLENYAFGVGTASNPIGGAYNTISTNTFNWSTCAMIGSGGETWGDGFTGLTSETISTMTHAVAFRIGTGLIDAQIDEDADTFVIMTSCFG